ncbi:MAG: hypothetical protein EPO63_08100 [Candidatus Nitrosotenuis sp.]|nr:MAG: hypothetical protein EPO63_08100 [Candidatus Nitrosotenuis sp.]
MIDLSRFSRRERLWLLYGGGVIIVILIYFAVAEPMMGRYRAMDGEIAGLADRVARYRAVVAGAGAEGRRQGAYGSALKSVAAASFTADTDALAAAQMAELVRAKALAAGITLGTSKPEKAVDFRGYRVLSLSVTFNAPLAALAGFMKELENDQKLMRITEAKIASQKQDYPDDVAETLSVRLLIAGLRYLPPNTVTEAKQ